MTLGRSSDLSQGSLLAAHSTESYLLTTLLAEENPKVSSDKLIAQADPADHAAPAETHAAPEAAHGEAHADEHAADGHAADAHGADHGGGHHDDAFKMPSEAPNIYTIFSAATAKHDDHGHGHEGGHHGPFWIDPLFSMAYAAFVLFVISRFMKRRSLEAPTKGQVAVETLFGGLLNFFSGILGPEGARKHIPFIGTLWIFIIANNLFGLIPGFKSPTGHFQITIGLGIVTFFYVNGMAIKEGGIKHFLWHLSGSPTNLVGWCLVPLMLVLETIGTLIKPISLSLRLFGNITGEDKLLATFMGLGLMLVGGLMGTAHPVIGIPLQFPFMFLLLLGSTIQATVFSLLAAVYIALLTPHEHHHDEAHGEGHDAHGHGAEGHAPKAAH